MDRKRKRNNGGNEPEWTAARCQRLLRPIASRIAPLRKLAYITDSKNPRPDLLLDSGSVAESSFAKAHKAADEPVWLRRQDERSKAQNYSSKARTARKDGKEDAQVSSISLPTPFRARALRRDTPGKTPGGTKVEDCKASPCVRLDNKHRKRQKKDPFNSVPEAMRSVELRDRQAFEKVFELHKGVTDGFSLLLERTREGGDKTTASHQGTKGTRSLFSACLKRVPDYIQAEEDWRQSIDPDDETDVCAEVYEELEDMGSAKGWAPLREVVRAHGIKLVNDIIREKLVSPNTRAEFSNMLLSNGERVDAERLAVTLAHSLLLKRPSNQASPLFERCMSSMLHLVMFGTREFSSRLHVLQSLFRSERLHVSWVATKDVTDTIGNAVRRLASSERGDHCRSTGFLGGILEQVLKLEEVIGQEQGTFTTAQIIPASLLGPFQNTVDSLLTVLTAMAIISGKEESESQRGSIQAATTLIQELTTVILTRTAKDLKQEASGCRLSPIAVRLQYRILASALIIATGQRETKADIVQLECDEVLALISLIASDSASKLAALQEMSAFIYGLSLCCGQSLRYDARDILEDLVGRLMTEAKVSPAEHRTFLQQLSLETALKSNLASGSSHSKKLLADLENTLQGHGSLLTRESRLHSIDENATFRWEEGLCEWIAATPFVSKGRDSVGAEVDQQAPVNMPFHNARSLGYNRAKSALHSKDYDGVNDSGYLSMHETPQPTRRPLSNLEILSPDELIGDFQDTQADLSSPIPTSPTASQHASSELSLETETVNSTPLDFLAKRSASHSLWRKQRMLLKYGSSHRGNTQETLAVASTTSLHPVKQDRPRDADVPKAPVAFTTVHAEKTMTPARSEVETAVKTVVEDDADVEFDELALSCRKKPLRQPLGRTTSGSKIISKQASFVGKGKMPSRINSAAASESDDELG